MFMFNTTVRIFNVKNLLDDNRTSQSAIDTIKQWLGTTPLPQLQEEFIALFLIACSNDITATKPKIEAYFRVKNKWPEYFDGWSLENEDMKKCLNVVNACIIPVRMDNNTAVSCMRLIDFNYRNFDLKAITKLSNMLTYLTQMSDPPNDVIILLDMKGTGFMHLTRMKIEVCRAYLEYVQDAMPKKIKSIHVLNSNFVFEKILTLVKMFMRSELRALINLHPPGMDMKEFQKKWVPAYCLPKEYGGSLPSFEELSRKSIEELRKIQPFFEAEERLRRLKKQQ